MKKDIKSMTQTPTMISPLLLTWVVLLIQRQRYLDSKTRKHNCSEDEYLSKLRTQCTHHMTLEAVLPSLTYHQLVEIVVIVSDALAEQFNSSPVDVWDIQLEDGKISMPVLYDARRKYYTLELLTKWLPADEKLPEKITRRQKFLRKRVATALNLSTEDRHREAIAAFYRLRAREEQALRNPSRRQRKRQRRSSAAMDERLSTLIGDSE